MTRTSDLMTIGYEGATIDGVIRSLHEAGVDLLIDVRAVPQSRKPGFSKRQLAAGLAEAAIDYVHLQALGTPKPGRDAVRAGHPEIMEAIFRDHMKSDRSTAALTDARLLAGARRCCLLCFESNPAHCHRRLVADMITDDTRQTIVHLHPQSSASQNSLL